MRHSFPSCLFTALSYSLQNFQPSNMSDSKECRASGLAQPHLHMREAKALRKSTVLRCRENNRFRKPVSTPLARRMQAIKPMKIVK